MSNIILYSADEKQEEPVLWQPDRKLADRAFNAHASLIRHGQVANRSRCKQAVILRWLHDDERRCYALGCEGGFEEYIKQEDVLEALGFADLSPGHASKLARLLIIGHGYLDMNLLADGLRSRAAAALPRLMDGKRKIDGAETTEEREAAREGLREDAERYVGMTTREIEAEADRRPPPCKLAKSGGQPALFSIETAELILVLHSGSGAARVVDCLTGARRRRYLWDLDGIWSVDPATGEIEKAATWARRFDEETMRRFAEAVPNCERRL